MLGPRLRLVVAASTVLAACQPELNVGEWQCAPGSDAAIPDMYDPIAMPWSTGFEDLFCDYTQLGGFCYGAPNASYRTVTSPVRSGRLAAAFEVNADDPDGYQARCVMQGELPTAAYYGAWYFVPERASDPGLWNLVHFQGADPPEEPHGLWDISLITNRDGDLEVVVFDFLNGMGRSPETPTPIPIGRWFQLELYWKRAADATGEVALYQDGELLIQATDIVTDDSSWGQWYVGNLAQELTPADSILYVDDVTIRAAQ